MPVVRIEISISAPITEKVSTTSESTAWPVFWA
jgi:hypothetical protein